MMGPLILVLSVGLFSFCWFALYNFNVIVFVLFCYILLSLRSLLFSDERRSESGRERRCEGIGKSRRRGICNQDLMYEKRIYFQ